jgi:SPP1 family holin
MNKQTIIRLVVLLIALINQALVSFGFAALPWSGDEIGTALSTVFTILATAWAWWKNNSVTKPAIAADKIMGLIRDGTVTIEEILAVVGKSDGKK